MFDKLWKSYIETLSGYFRLSDEHKQSVASGKCLSCGGRVLPLSDSNVNCYAKDGTKLLSAWQRTKTRPEVLECKQCSYRWRIYSTSPPIVEVLGIIEMERHEEPIGEERRLIDNSKSSTKLTRKISISREWTKTYSIEYEKSQIDGTEVDIGVSESVGIKASSEETIRKQYSISEEVKETYLDEVEVEVSGFTKLSLAFHWKRIWQHGFIRLCTQNDKELNIPFRIAVGITFDQLQIDEKS